MQENCHQLVYTSRACHKMSQEELNAISDKAQTVNKKNNVTGILIYRDGYFLQLLEGDLYSVHHTFKKIMDDSRHKSIQVLVDSEVEARLFHGWSMLYKTLDDADPELLKKVVLLFKEKTNDTSKTLNALWSFYGIKPESV